MANTLRQAVAGGSGSGTITTPGTNVSCSGFFSSTTLSGSLLIGIVFSKGQVNSGVFNPALSAATSGITWTTLFTPAWGTSNPKGLLGIFYCQNAASVSSATANVFTMAQVAGTGNVTSSIECTIYEVTGALLSGTITQVTQQRQLQSGGTVSSGTVSPVANDFLITAYNGTTGGLTNGAAFTLGPNPGVLGGGSQYIINTVGGSQSCAFVGSGPTDWCAATVGFKTEPAPAATGFTQGCIVGF